MNPDRREAFLLVNAKLAALHQRALEGDETGGDEWPRLHDEWIRLRPPDPFSLEHFVIAAILIGLMLFILR